jgi:hypothetical protein
MPVADWSAGAAQRAEVYLERWERAEIERYAEARRRLRAIMEDGATNEGVPDKAGRIARDALYAQEAKLHG